MEILDIVDREAKSHGAGSVTSVHLRIGDLSGVEISSLSFCFEAIRGEKERTRAAELVIDRVPVKVRCGPCEETYAGDGPLLRCPACGGLETELLEGDEMNVVEIEIE
jgi:hydrogenase nickel incorporation protein HypA/HybF